MRVAYPGMIQAAIACAIGCKLERTSFTIKTRSRSCPWAFAIRGVCPRAATAHRVRNARPRGMPTFCAICRTSNYVCWPVPMPKPIICQIVVRADAQALVRELSRKPYGPGGTMAHGFCPCPILPGVPKAGKNAIHGLMKRFCPHCANACAKSFDVYSSVNLCRRR